MPLAHNDLLRVARLARLHLDPQETRRLTDQLDRILAFIRTLDEVDTTNVEPWSGTRHPRNFVRPDSPQQPFTPEQILRNAPDRKDDVFRVPPVIDGA